MKYAHFPNRGTIVSRVQSINPHFPDRAELVGVDGSQLKEGIKDKDGP